MPSIRWAIQAFFVGLLLVGPAHALYYLGVKQSSATETSVLNVSSPVWVAFLAIFILREKVGALRWIATGLACAGAYIVAIGFQLPRLDQGHALGNLIYIGGVLAECLAMILAIRIIRQSSGMGALVWEVTGAAAACWLLVLLFPSVYGIHVAEASVRSLWPTFYLALVSGVFCFSLWYISAEKAPISLMSLTLGIQGLTAAVIGTFLLGEELSVQLVVGFLVIFGALMLAARESHAPAPEPAGYLVGDLEEAVPPA